MLPYAAYLLINLFCKCIRVAGFGYLHHNGAFNAFFVKFTAHFIYTGDASGGVVSVGRTAAAAIQASETILAFLVGVYVAKLKFIAYLLIGYAGEHVSQQEFRFSHKLVAGIQVSAGSNSHVFGSHAAA